MEDKDARIRAREVARTRYRLRWHVVTYVLVNVGLLFTWWNTGRASSGRPFPIFFWGMGVVVHYLNAYRSGEHAWIARETEKILREREDESGRSLGGSDERRDP